MAQPARAYDQFLSAKSFVEPLSGHTPGPTHRSLYPFQRALIRWAVRRGRAAIFADCGLGKTRMQIEWVRQMRTFGNGPGLIVCPLAVAEQTIAEASDIAVDITFAQSSSDLTQAGISITNYEKMHKFVGADIAAIVLDESSILKSVDGKTRTLLLTEFASIPRKLCCTATPAPNDIAEFANHCEFLGVMSRVEMLATFFVHDQDGWRLKGHAVDDFYHWMVKWGMFLRKPSDIGFDDDGFDLPPLHVEEHMVDSDFCPEGLLFPARLGGVSDRAQARKSTITPRAERVADLIAGTGDEQWVVWCGLNDEGRELAGMLGEGAVLIEGSDSPKVKLDRHARWKEGEVRTLITKPSIFGWGMNWQHCNRVAFLGMGDSYEQYYQAIRRCWRFGQADPVDVAIVVSEAEACIVDNVKRKEKEAAKVAEGIIANVADIEAAEVLGADRQTDEYVESADSGAGWDLWLGDSCERIKEIEDKTVGLSVFSPPFASLYTYSNSERDLGNSKDYEQFFEHFGFLASEILRVTQPCRRSCVHVQQVTTTKATHGKIGWRDFRADVVRLFVESGWIYDGEVVIDKDPQAQAIRTKSKALMFAQKDKDSAWSRPAMADYILLFRAPGENDEPIKTDVSNEEWIKWARPIWYDIRESNTLNVREARSDKDERHICPLQLETIERCVRLWSNPGDLVFSPFAGIGSEGYEAIRLGRRFLGIELKPAYFRVAGRNLLEAEKLTAGLFAGLA